MSYQRFECGYQEMQTTEHVVVARDRDRAAQRFREETGNWPQWVSADAIVGICEQCSKPVFEDQPAAHWEDVVLHRECAEVAS